MIEEILPGLYRTEIPLPKSPLKAVNSYVVKGEGRFLVIDTGWNCEECLQPMLSAMRKLNVDLNKTDFFITHLHIDHLGLAGTLATEKSAVYFNEIEASVAKLGAKKSEERKRGWFTVLSANGFPEKELKKAFGDHPAYRYSLKIPGCFSLMREGDTLEIGDYLFKGIETPGHSPGHTCLYEPNKKILVSGDHILFDITPNITCWPELENSLKYYLASLEKVYSLDVELVLPGHRGIGDNHRKRIAELQEHHKNRLNEVILALGNEAKTAWEVAPYVTWSINCDSWKDFPPGQKWFAVGETIAHLNYLEAEGKVRREIRKDKIFYLLA